MEFVGVAVLDDSHAERRVDALDASMDCNEAHTLQNLDRIDDRLLTAKRQRGERIERWVQSPVHLFNHEQHGAEHAYGDPAERAPVLALGTASPRLPFDHIGDEPNPSNEIP